MTWPEQFAPRAIRDVEEAVDWLADNGGPDIARRMARAVVEAARRVVERPLVGRVRPDLLPADFRVWAVQGFPYLLVYDGRRSPPKIERVLHMARDLQPLLAEFASAADEAPNQT